MYFIAFDKLADLVLCDLKISVLIPDADNISRTHREMVHVATGL